MNTNTHPADELYDVRAQIKALEDREAELRAKLLSGECGLDGGAYIAWIVEQEQARFDGTAARQALGDDVLAPFTITRRVRQVRLAARHRR
jgi:hypothetical protein